MRQHPLRECFIVLGRDLPSVAVTWLQDNPPPRPPPPQELMNSRPARPALESSGQLADPSAPSNSQVPRRGSVSSCRNIFSVDGNVVEVGFDRLQRIDSQHLQAANSSTSKNNAENDLPAFPAATTPADDNDDIFEPATWANEENEMDWQAANAGTSEKNAENGLPAFPVNATTPAAMDHDDHVDDGMSDEFEVSDTATWDGYESAEEVENHEIDENKVADSASGNGNKNFMVSLNI